jgi:cyclophilin family peptidyl-prolyl cis-trans isomerase
MLRSRKLAVFAIAALAFSGTACAQEKSVSKTESDPAVVALDAFIEESKIDKSAKEWKESLPRPPQQTFSPDAQYFWMLETSKGPIKVKLMPEAAPMHVSSTVYLTRVGFYDDLISHRVIDGFMAQGGDPTGTGRGGPGYKYAGEFSGDLKHDKPGLLSMANAGPGTDGSQFFLTFVPTPWLDGRHTIFGEVVEGMDALQQLEAAGSQSGQTSERLTLDKAQILIE